MKVLGLVGIMLISVACNNAAPTATAYKEQLGAPAAVTGNGNATTDGGDIEKGKAAFTASCAGCHGPGAMAPLDGSEDIKAGFGANGAHTSFKSVFDNDAANISAYLKSVNGGTPAATGGGDAAAGEALLKAQCEGCHNPDGTGMGPALDQFATLAGQEAKQIHAGVAANFTDATKKADIQAALSARK